MENIYTLFVAFKYIEQELELGMISTNEKDVDFFISKNKSYIKTWIGNSEEFPSLK